MSKLRTPKFAGEVLGGDKPLSIRTLAYWRKTGTGPAWVKIGRAIRYPEDDLIAFVEKNKNV